MNLPDWTKKELKMPKLGKPGLGGRKAKASAAKAKPAADAQAAAKPSKGRPGLKLPSRPKLSAPKLSRGRKPKAAVPAKARATRGKPKRPAIKAPAALGGVKAPESIVILGRQLREQRLIPVVAILIAGLVAIPLLLGGSSSKEEATARGPAGTKEGEAANASALVVQKWTPGLLEAKHRLEHQSPTDPFASKATAEGTGSGSSETGVEGEEAEVVEAPESGGAEVPPGEGSPESGGESPETSPTPKEPEEKAGEESGSSLQSTSIEVKIAPVHAPGSKAPKHSEYIGHKLPQLTKLPSEAVPALTYIGLSPDRQKALMSVSPEVVAMLGASKCVTGAKPCQILALEIGAPETIVYGQRGLTYRIELLKIGVVDDDSTAPRSMGTAIAIGEAIAVVP